MTEYDERVVNIGLCKAGDSYIWVAQILKLSVCCTCDRKSKPSAAVIRVAGRKDRVLQDNNTVLVYTRTEVVSDGWRVVYINLIKVEGDGICACTIFTAILDCGCKFSIALIAIMAEYNAAC